MHQLLPTSCLVKCVRLSRSSSLSLPCTSACVVYLSASSSSSIIYLSNQMSPGVRSVLEAKGISQFTDIQRQAFDPLFEGRDCLARSRTGTGKTLAFGLPILERIASEVASGEYDTRRGRSPRMLIMAPTRELARQVLSYTMARSFSLKINNHTSGRQHDFYPFSSIKYSRAKQPSWQLSRDL